MCSQYFFTEAPACFITPKIYELDLEFNVLQDLIWVQQWCIKIVRLQSESKLSANVIKLKFLQLIDIPLISQLLVGRIKPMY